MNRNYKSKIRELFKSSETDKVSGMSVMSTFADLYRSQDTQTDKDHLSMALVELAHDAEISELLSYAWLGDALSDIGIFIKGLPEVLEGRILHLMTSGYNEKQVIDKLQLYVERMYRNRIT